jgi:hypothetical protein
VISLRKEEKFYMKIKILPIDKKNRYFYKLTKILIKEENFNVKIIDEFLKYSIEENNIMQFIEIYFKIMDDIYKKEKKTTRGMGLIIKYMPTTFKYLYSKGNIETMHVEILFKKIEILYERYGINTRRIHQEKFKYYVNLGMWEKSFKSFSKWMNTNIDENSFSIGLEEADRAYYYFLIGDRQTGKHIFENVENGILRDRNLRIETIPRNLKYQIEEGNLEGAVQQAITLYKMTQKRERNLHINSELMKIIFLYKETMAFEIWRREYNNYLKTPNDFDRFHFGVVTHLLYKSFINNKKSSKQTMKMKKVVEEMYSIQEMYDTKNKNTHFKEEIFFWENVFQAIETYRLKQEEG